MVDRKKGYAIAGAVWCLLFAIISFYWASGGMIGVRSLGGSIQELAIQREPSFVAIVWITGILKVIGGLFLLCLLKRWPNKTGRIFYSVALVGGVLLVIYGFVNAVTLILSNFGMMDLALDSFALKWRLYFWEPFWMVGGVLFILSAVRFKRDRTVSSEQSVSK